MLHWEEKPTRQPSISSSASVVTIVIGEVSVAVISSKAFMQLSVPGRRRRETGAAQPSATTSR